jgi:large subunit ribosomal protein L23
MENLDQIILGSVLSEKSVALSSHNQFVLKVAMHATKPQVAQAIKDVFNVNVKKVRTLIVRGETRRRPKSKKGGYSVAKKPNFKKAIVTLEKGQTLPVASSASNLSSDAISGTTEQ